MTALVLAVAWAAVVVSGARRHRPPPARVHALKRDHGSATVRARAARLPLVGELRRRPGGWILGRLGREASAAAAHRLGGAVLAGAAAGLAFPLAAAPAALLAWAIPGFRAARAERRRLAALAADVPDVVDLLVLAVGAGLTVRLAVTAVARRATGPLAAHLGRVMEEASLGRRLADALDDVPERAGEAVRPLVAALVASERYGASLSGGLERLADELRRDRRRHAEEAARKVPVKLLFPLVTCTLPAFGLLTVAPLIASAIRSLPL